MRSFKNNLLKLTLSPVFWLVSSLFAVLIPHFQRFPLWISLSIVSIFFWRLLAINNEKILPKKWLLGIIGFFVFGAILYQYGSILGKTPGTAFLSALLAIKLLESKNKRDFMILIALSFFIIVTNFLFSQSIFTAIYMLITVVLLVISMISINLNHLTLRLQDKLKISVKLVMQALPLMLILFVLFPRIPGPLWKLPNDSSSAISGLSNSMSPGNISQLIQSSKVAFRVKFKSSPPVQKQLYWRAMVLWNFDGRVWTEGTKEAHPNIQLEGFSEPIEYSVTLEPHNKNYIFSLDMPVKASNNSIYTGNYVLRSKNKIDSLKQYSIQSFLNYRIDRNLTKWQQKTALALPDHGNNRTIALAKEWKQKLIEPADIINRALNYFNTELFSYTLNPPLTPGRSPVDDFLFNTKKGFCEHYASSFSLLMRAAGIPARVVLGYQGGRINPIDKFLTVAQSDAHAWTEVWLKDRGWIRIDPTAAIAPERIEMNLNSALSNDEIRPLHLYLDYGPLKNIMHYWNAVDNGWKQWVVGYNPEQQKKFLSSIFNKDMSFYQITIVLLIILFSAALLMTLYIFKTTDTAVTDPVKKHYDKFCLKLSRRGCHRLLHEGPLDYYKRASQCFPEQKNNIKMIINIYIKLRYSASTREQDLTTLKQRIKKLKF